MCVRVCSKAADDDEVSLVMLMARQLPGIYMHFVLYHCSDQKRALAPKPMEFQPAENVP